MSAEALTESPGSAFAWFAYDAADAIWVAVVASAGLDTLTNGDKTDIDSSELSDTQNSWAWTAVAAVVLAQCMAIVSDVTRARRALVVGMGVVLATAMLVACAMYGSGPWAVAALCVGRMAALTNRALYDSQVPFVLSPVNRAFEQGIGAVVGMCGALAVAAWAMLIQFLWGEWHDQSSGSNEAERGDSSEETRRVTLGLRVYGGVAAGAYTALLSIYAFHRQRAAQTGGRGEVVTTSSREARLAMARGIGTSHTPPLLREQERQHQHRYVSAGQGSAPASGCGVAVAVFRDVFCDRNGACIGLATCAGLATLYSWLPSTASACSSIIDGYTGRVVVPCLALALAVVGALCGCMINARFGCRRSALCGFWLLMGAEALFLLAGFNAPGDWQFPMWLAWFAVAFGGLALGVIASSLRMLQVMLAAPSRAAQMVACFRAGGVILAAFMDKLVAYIIHTTLLDSGVIKAVTSALQAPLPPAWDIIDSWRVVFLVRAGLALVGIFGVYELVDPSQMYNSGIRAPYDDIYATGGRVPGNNSGNDSINDRNQISSNAAIINEDSSLMSSRQPVITLDTNL